MGRLDHITQAVLGFSEAIVASGSVRVALRSHLMASIGNKASQSAQEYAIALALPVGIVKRPQDHNGIVDDAVTALSLIHPTSELAGGACAVAATVAALLDGWGMEGAVDLALFVGKRGQTFGSRGGQDVIAQIRASIDAVEERMTTNGTHLGSSLPKLVDVGLVPRALGLAYAYRHAGRAARAAMDSIGGGPVVAALAAAICAADQPGAYLKETEAVSGDVEDLVRRLVLMRDSWSGARTRRRE